MSSPGGVRNSAAWTTLPSTTSTEAYHAGGGEPHLLPQPQHRDERSSPRSRPTLRTVGLPGLRRTVGASSAQKASSACERTRCRYRSGASCLFPRVPLNVVRLPETATWRWCQSCARLEENLLRLAASAGMEALVEFDEQGSVYPAEALAESLYDLISSMGPPRWRQCRRRSASRGSPPWPIGTRGARAMRRGAAAHRGVAGGPGPDEVRVASPRR